jgi:hypothetical protein
MKNFAQLYGRKGNSEGYLAPDSHAMIRGGFQSGK